MDRLIRKILKEILLIRMVNSIISRLKGTINKELMNRYNMKAWKHLIRVLLWSQLRLKHRLKITKTRFCPRYHKLLALFHMSKLQTIRLILICKNLMCILSLTNLKTAMILVHQKANLSIMKSLLLKIKSLFFKMTRITKLKL